MAKALVMSKGIQEIQERKRGEDSEGACSSALMESRDSKVPSGLTFASGRNTEQKDPKTRW